jgi:hypothetical protein
MALVDKSSGKFTRTLAGTFTILVEDDGVTISDGTDAGAQFDGVWKK